MLRRASPIEQDARIAGQDFRRELEVPRGLTEDPVLEHERRAGVLPLGHEGIDGSEAAE